MNAWEHAKCQNSHCNLLTDGLLWPPYKANTAARRFKHPTMVNLPAVALVRSLWTSMLAGREGGSFFFAFSFCAVTPPAVCKLDIGWLKKDRAARLDWSKIARLLLATGGGSLTSQSCRNFAQNQKDGEAENRRERRRRCSPLYPSLVPRGLRRRRRLFLHIIPSAEGVCPYPVAIREGRSSNGRKKGGL